MAPRPGALLAAAWALGLLAAQGRVVSVADLHGDIDRTVDILSAAGLIDRTTQAWTGGSATLVQTGDIVDRGDNGRRIYELFFRLAKQAPEHGGRVVNLLGNHELMNIQEDLRYVSPKDYDQFGGEEQRRTAWLPDGWLGKQVRAFPAAAKVENILFVHAGLHPALLPPGSGVEGLNAKMAAAVAGNGRPEELAGDLAELVQDSGPVWTRLYGEVRQGACENAREVLKATGAARMVVGHTIQQGYHVRSVCGGQVVLADTGISRAYGGELAFIEHDGLGGAEVVYPVSGDRVKLPHPEPEFALPAHAGAKSAAAQGSVAGPRASRKLGSQRRQYSEVSVVAGNSPDGPRGHVVRGPALEAASSRPLGAVLPAAGA